MNKILEGILFLIGSIMILLLSIYFEQTFRFLIGYENILIIIILLPYKLSEIISIACIILSIIYLILYLKVNKI